jgi:hypothetical protein
VWAAFARSDGCQPGTFAHFGLDAPTRVSGPDGGAISIGALRQALEVEEKKS